MYAFSNSVPFSVAVRLYHGQFLSQFSSFEDTMSVTAYAPSRAEFGTDKKFVAMMLEDFVTELPPNLVVDQLATPYTLGFRYRWQLPSARAHTAEVLRDSPGGGGVSW